MDQVIYKFRKPIFRDSSKLVEVFGENQEKVGEFRRVFKNTFHRIIELLLNNPIMLNVEAFGVNQSVTCKINEKWGMNTLVRSKWDGNSSTIGKFILTDKTVVKTNPRLECQSIDGEKLYIIKKDFADKRVFVENVKGGTLAEVIYDKPIPPQNITIKLRTQELNIMDIVCLYLILDQRD